MLIFTWLAIAIVSADVKIIYNVSNTSETSNFLNKSIIDNATNVITTEISNAQNKNIVENVAHVITTEIPNAGNNRSHRSDTNILNLEKEQSNEDVITTEYGPVRGFKKDSGILWQYFDIPYGAFNIENPFQEPSPPKSWSEIREEYEHKSRCPQIDPNSETYTGTQDCLTLSIFTPIESQNNDVLFHVHDGSFSSGSGDDQVYGPGYLVPKGIILVLPNYRLGPLGFLCLRSEAIPGNAGLKDLVLALKWTKNNIEAFGGNSSNIVVSGSGSGAALVEYLATSTKSKHLISKAITESGFMLSNWAIDRQPLETAAILDENLRKINSYSTIISFTSKLTETSLEELVKASKGIIFKPCVETSAYGFLTNTPMSVLSSANININYMIGAANFAGMHKVLQYTNESISQINNNFTLLLPNDLQLEDETKHEIAKLVKTQYFNEHEITLKNIHKLSLCYTDHSYLSPAIRGARLFVSAGATVYFYEFSFGPEEENVAELGESMKYVFNRGNIIFVDNSKEYKMENLMTNLWVSFIKTGIPKSDGVDWKKFEKTKDENEKWLSVGSIVKLEEGIHLDRLKLWEDIYKKHFIDRNKTIHVKSDLFTILISLAMIVKCHKNYSD